MKAQREALGWPVEQVADQLKLAPRQVIALEEGDMAALPNLAVVRGFVRAYAKVVRLDAAPLVAMIEVHPAPTQQDPAAPVRREISATFSESRFPSMTQRSSNQTPLWIAGAVAVVVAAAFGAYKLGYVPAGLLSSQAGKETAHAEVGPVETTLIKPGQDLTPVQSPSVPLISVPPPPGNDTQTGAPAAVASAQAAAVVPPAAVPAPAPAATAAATPPAAAAAVGANALVLKVEQDSWVEIRRPGSTPLISRMVKAGSTETFDITGPATLVVGKPGVVQATLRGAKLDLPTVAGGTISRVSIK
ncbi:helix-turn-helix domain-containing protein [Janthinobacterium lividum]|uniref:Helix-turn-helix domain-containing protein n=1 Tax=Janthinobacterium lividum TaxID=29581 RepID=A0ABU0XQQ2_9BURK|nr:helix-turn-helix domain-containing protein [Janthinobacterium lividum]MDQ4625853.1 helix-turn-helix domain-containing protein [Janthinobacterium lividum]MDQ4672544.1 helix-turn-helix domain-containing protein [Janthinobacterium lividum]MDQ4683272.1 helix-turn-helix domain-containing protein [Janthinobacterium lividum]